MAYQDNNVVTIDAILTTKGRELLSQGSSDFNITQFALSDDEIDYDLYNPAHPQGSEYYGVVIENMPLTEALPDEKNSMRFKLVTLDKKTTVMPQLDAGVSNITLSGSGQKQVISPTTKNLQGANATQGYTLVLSDSDVADVRVTRPLLNGSAPTIPRFIGDSDSSQTVSVIGFEFEIIAKPSTRGDQYATVTVIGNETGGRVSINVLVKQLTVNEAVSNPTVNLVR